MRDATRVGFLYGLGAYLWWGLVPIYFAWLGKYPPFDFLAHRIAWSAVFLGLILTATRRWGEVMRCLTSPKLLAALSASAVLVAGNWLLYVLCVDHEQITEASLGYFILPLINVVLGMAVFGESLRPLQQAAILLALIGVGLLTWKVGAFPWYSLGIALSFSLYGLIRKQAPVDGLIGLSVETMLLFPFTLLYLLTGYVNRGEIEATGLFVKLLLSGVITAVPLLCFGEAARRLPFAILGMMQYIAPSVQFLLAVWVFQESVSDWNGYIVVWMALVIFSIDSYRWYHRQQSQAINQEQS